MYKQRIENFQLQTPKKADGKDQTEQINELIEKLNNEGKRVLSISYGMGQWVTLLYEYE